jgi:type IV secretory pathway VirB10-like protein
LKRRYVVLSLSLVLALALAVPALGGPSNPIASTSASVKQIATKALKKAKAAQTTANTALATATSAQGAASAAQSDVGKVQKEVKTAQSTADAAKSAAATAQSAAATAQTTADAAKGAAANAQSTADAAKAAADAAQATANTKLGETFTEFGDGSGNSTTSGTDFVECPGSSEVTGGGYTTGGAGANQAVPVFTAAYGDAWVASLERIPGQAGTWSVQAVVTCAQ